MDCSSPGSSVHGILQGRILEWVATSFSRGSSQPRDQAWVSCIAGRFLTIWATTTWMNLKNIMLTEEWINKMWYIYTMEYYSAIKNILKLFLYIYLWLCWVFIAAAAAAKSLQSCLTLRDPTDGSSQGSPFPGILQKRTLEWVAISFSNAWKWKWSRSVVSDS